MRKGFVGAGLAAVVLISGAVAAQDNLAAVDPSGQTVTYWHQFSGAQLETMTQLVEQFNTTNEWGITVEALAQGSYNDIRELMNGAIVSGETPDLVAGFANDAASYFLDSAAVDLTPYVNDPEIGVIADFDRDLLNFNTVTAEPFNGALLAFPHQSSAQVFIANTTLLEELGFSDVPRTIEEFTAAACASAQSTTADGTQRFGWPITTDASQLESWVASFGGQIFDGANYQFTSEPVINALTLYKTLYDQGCGYIPAERFSEQTDFALGLTPFFASSTAGFTFVLQANADNGFAGEWTVNSFPHTEGNEILQLFVPSIIMVPSTPEEQRASWEFLKFLVTPEAAALWSEGTGYFNPVPSTAALVTLETFGNAELFPYYNQGAALLANPEVRPYNGPNVPSYGQIRGLVSEAIANVTSNGMAVEEAAQQLQAQADEIVAGG